MLKSLYLDGFRLWSDTTISFNETGPTVLIGPNASGKSSILEALAFLSLAASDTLSEAVYVVRGGPADFVRAGADRLTLRVVLDSAAGLPTDSDGGPVEYELQLLRDGPYLRVHKERISVYKRGLGTEPLHVVERTPSQCWLLNSVTHQKDQIDISPERLLFETARQLNAYPTLRNVREALSGLRVYTDLASAPRWALSAEERAQSARVSGVVKPQRSLDARGRELINTLYTLSQDNAHTWDYLVRQLQGEFPFVERLSFPPDPGGSRVSLAWTDRRFSGQRTAEQMSSGMWVFLAHLAALLPADPALLLAFDEPDTHMHPSALRRLIGLLEEAAVSTTVLFTTHSTRTLDELADVAASVQLCQPSSDGTELLTLDSAATEAWLEHYDTAGRMREAGLLDRENAG